MSGPVPGSGDDAVARAEERAATTRDVNLENLPPLPIPADTANVRLGAPIDEALLALLPLVGVWRGSGMFANGAVDGAPQFGQQIVIAHDGRAFLRFESMTWLLHESGEVASPGEREVGWMRPDGAEGMQLLLAHAEGRIETYRGRAQSLTTWELASDATWSAPDGRHVVGATRLYGITADGALAYVEERTLAGGEPTPHASAVLARIAG